MARKRAEHSGVMGDDAERLRARRQRLDLSQEALAQKAHVNRDTIAAIERGQGFRRSSLTKIEKALDDLEHEAGLDVPPPEPEQQLVEFEVRIEGEPTITVVARGRGAREEIREEIAALVRRLRANEKNS